MCVCLHVCHVHATDAQTVAARLMFMALVLSCRYVNHVLVKLLCVLSICEYNSTGPIIHRPFQKYLRVKHHKHTVEIGRHDSD